MKKQLTFFTSLLAALALSVTAYAAATDVKFQVRNETDGLGDPTVNSAFAESNYVYAATDYGLAIRLLVVMLQKNMDLPTIIEIYRVIWFLVFMPRAAMFM